MLLKASPQDGITAFDAAFAATLKALDAARVRSRGHSVVQQQAPTAAIRSKL